MKIRSFVSTLFAISAFVVSVFNINTPSMAYAAGAEANSSNARRASWSTAYGGADKSYDMELLQLRELISPRFKTLRFEDEVTGKTMLYNLYVPEGYDDNKRYPLVLFMADASTTGKGPEAPLKQGYGGIVWATDESQAKNPCFVLVPVYAGPEYVVNDQWQVSDEVDMTLRLLQSIVSRYNIDKDRLYATGQSMGGMISFYLNANHPDLFAASIFVGSQWDIKVLEPLAKMKFFYIVSGADQKASTGMEELGNMLQRNEVSVGATEFSARLSDSEKEEYILDLLKQGHCINFVQFTPGTVIPAGAKGPGGEHMYSFDYAYKLTAVRDWLFQQTRRISRCELQAWSKPAPGQ
jgi:predicted peptidase